MKQLFFIQIFIFVFTFCFSQNVDQIKGFKSGIFGMSDEKLINKKTVYESEISKTYKNEEEDLAFGDYSFFQIDYTFFEKKLWKISAHCSGSDNIIGILKMLYKSYGNCEIEKLTDKKDILKYSWKGTNVEISMVTFDDFTSAKLVLCDKEMENAIINSYKNENISIGGFHDFIISVVK